MKLILDEKICNKKKLDLQEVLLLLSIRTSEKFSEVLKGLEEKKAIVKEFGEYVITQHYNDVVDEIIADSSGFIDDEEWLTSLAKDFAQTFPKGKMPNSPYYYRCNTRELVLKFKRFFLLHPEYKPSEQIKERIIDAAKRYNREMDFDPKYRTLSKYFISKIKQVLDEEGIVHNEEVSQLATYLENEGQEESETQDWLVHSMN